MFQVEAPTGELIVVDEETHIRLDGRAVTMGSHGYAQIWDGEKPVLLHRWVLGLEVGNPAIADHINGDRLDNRQENLRVVDGTTSNLNRCVKGNCVYQKPSGAWEAKLSHQGKKYYLGTFATRSAAKEAVDQFRERMGIVHLRYANS